MSYENRVEIEKMVGKTLIHAENTGDEINFICSDGTRFKMLHDQNCCESVSVEDIVGDLSDLYNSPILEAREETNSKENPEGITKEYQDSFTWTFYILRTMNATVTIRWYGESNGCYSESVELEMYPAEVVEERNPS